MALPIPVLDDRSYEQLRDELLRRIDVYSPEWTDRGPSDPGVTLLELFAFLGENLLFRFNQIPDQTRLWLLRLLQLPPRPARPSRGLVTFSLESPNPVAFPDVTLGASVLAGSLPFRVGNDVRVLPVTATAVIKAAASAPTDPVLGEELTRVLDAAELTADQAQPYTSAKLEPDPGAPGFESLDVSTAVDHVLWIAVQPAPGSSDATIAALFTPTGPLASDPLVLGVARDLAYPTIDEVDPCDGLDEPPERVRVREAATAAAIAACEPAVTVAGPEPPGGAPAAVDSTLRWQVSSKVVKDGEPEYLDATVARDTTDGLTRDGVVALRLPAREVDRIGVVPLDDEDLAGVGDRPPVLDSDRPVLFWLRAFPRQGVPEIGRISWLGSNTAEVEQLAEAAPEFLGTGAGMPHQELALSHPSVVPGSLRIQAEEHGDWVDWEVVETFAASRPSDRHATLDAAAGVVRGGDTVRGRAFGIGDRIRALGYRYGGGLAGNVAPRAISAVEAVTGVRVENPLRLAGGEDAETITDALARIPGEFARHDRAVTASDFRELAAIQGVGRAECLPRFDPKTKSIDAAGVVTVMVWPTADPLHPDAPVPDAALLRAVCQTLDERRLVTTELYVIPPTYRRVAVSVGLAVRPGYSAIGVRRWVELVLRQYLAPLPPYGPGGTGWPHGHRVHGPELEAAVLQVDGVDFIEDLRVADLSGASPIQGTVELEWWEVPELAELTVVLGQPPEPGSGGVGPPPSPTPVPVPVPREEC
ncbi:MAG: putative baseplate assembly protein [Egibacteraceae bacterium]